jgi:hypothetical protein
MLFFFSMSCISTASFRYSCTYQGPNSVTMTNDYDDSATAWVDFVDSYLTVGWGKVSIWTNQSSSSHNQMYCAGYADGYATAARIREAYDLYNDSILFDESTQHYPESDWPTSWQEWFNSTIAYLRTKTANAEDPYWVRTGLILTQFDGLVQGYNARALEIGLRGLREIDLWILQSAGDLEDLETILTSAAPVRSPEEKLHGTALVKLAPGNSDIFFAHATWGDVRWLHAYIKEYTFNVAEFATHRISLSTRTGRLASTDDFWTNDQGLLVFETTIHNFNTSLTRQKVKHESVLTWLRSYHAMLSSADGPSWSATFSRENSGTFNSEYVILDTKKFVAGEPLPADTLWMVEQLPGLIVGRDVTELLTNKTYVEGINSPHFDEIWLASDGPGAQASDPTKAELYSISTQIRALLIARDAPAIDTYEAFQTFMQYNDYLHDPLMVIPGTDQREPGHGILARCDLRPANGTDWGTRRHFGGLDVKAVRVSVWTQSHAWDARAGMAANASRGVPPFNFSDWPAVAHNGIRGIPVYEWTRFEPGDKCAIAAEEGDEDACLDVAGCGFCVATQQCVGGSADGPDPYLNRTCEAGWEFRTPVATATLVAVIVVSGAVVLFVVAAVGMHVYRRCRAAGRETSDCAAPWVAEHGKRIDLENVDLLTPLHGSGRP